MKVLIRQKFIDKYTGAMYRPGDTVELDEGRVAEIQAVLPQALDVKKTAKKAAESKVKTKKAEDTAEE